METGALVFMILGLALTWGGGGLVHPAGHHVRSGGAGRPGPSLTAGGGPIPLPGAGAATGCASVIPMGHGSIHSAFLLYFLLSRRDVGQ